jgi:hypothetical protein
MIKFITLFKAEQNLLARAPPDRTRDINKFITVPYRAAYKEASKKPKGDDSSESDVDDDDDDFGKVSSFVLAILNGLRSGQGRPVYLARGNQ